ncbi:hypothetical protein IC1_06057 [Bacillus cereus VD022]|uniref:Uncharacterized protein n=1 Tax=Bacillus cereus TIAC219 TaxID=718222 RepID=A0ABC9SPM0_BACCE|nr:hypothetical protein IC1_06057 [Bacillus cereus VD022]EOQ56317.1 hypothetical protein IAY_05746 [Bacillus cereus TIAC219]
MNGLYVSSEDEKANYPKFYRNMLDHLAKAQRVYYCICGVNLDRDYNAAIKSND